MNNQHLEQHTQTSQNKKIKNYPQKKGKKMNFLFALFLLLAAFGQFASPMWLKAGSKLLKNILKVAAKNSFKTVKKTKLGKIIPKKKTRKATEHHKMSVGRILLMSKKKRYIYIYIYT